MNNQIPYGFIPQFNNNSNVDLKSLIDRIETLERRVMKLEKKVNMLENTNAYPPQQFPNNYMI